MSLAIGNWGASGAQITYDDQDQLMGPPERVILVSALDILRIALKLRDIAVLRRLLAVASKRASQACAVAGA